MNKKVILIPIWLRLIEFNMFDKSKKKSDYSKITHVKHYLCKSSTESKYFVKYS